MSFSQWLTEQSPKFCLVVANELEHDLVERLEHNEVLSSTTYALKRAYVADSSKPINRFVAFTSSAQGALGGTRWRYVTSRDFMCCFEEAYRAYLENTKPELMETPQ